MTKLGEWLIFVSLFLGSWFMVISGRYQNKWTEQWMHIIWPMPIIVLGIFGFYSLFVVLWRTYHFNDCPEAAKELRKQIAEAKADLKTHGLTWD